MKFIKPLIVSFSMLAFATAYAADEPKAKSEKQDAVVKEGAQSTTGQAPAAAGSTTTADQPKARSEKVDAQDKSGPASSSAASESGPTKKSEPKARSEKQDAAAGGATGSTKHRSFTSLDTNNDGHIARAEIAAHADLAGKFKAADMDNDGRLSRAEYDAMVKADGGAASGSTTKADQPKARSETTDAQDKSRPASSSAAGASGPTKKSEPKAKSEKQDAGAGGATTK